jgi:hypothetical protein
MCCLPLLWEGRPGAMLLIANFEKTLACCCTFAGRLGRRSVRRAATTRQLSAAPLNHAALPMVSGDPVDRQLQ